MTTHHLTTMARVSATTTPRGQYTATIRRAFRQVRKSLTTCHSLITARRGMRWTTLIMTQTQTPTKLSTSWTCGTRRRIGLFCIAFFGPVQYEYLAYLTCILSITCSHCSMRNAYCSYTNYSAG